ncbi:MAG: CBS domain-containing protein, partial [Anaerolineae bacterium]
STVAEILDLTPVIVNEETSLPDVARTMIGDPTVTVACVVNKRRRLVGLLPLQTLADDLFLLVMPEDFLVETRSLEDVLHFAHLSHTKTAGDAMIPPVWVTADTPMKEAFRNMHRHKLLGIPVIDEAHHVVGYINLLEMLELYARQQPPAPPALQGGDDD